MTTIDPTDPMPGRSGPLERFAPLGALIFAVWLLIGFFTSDDYEDTPASVLAYAESDETNIIATAVLAMATPLLIGWFLYGLLARLPAVETALRAVIAVAGALFVAFLSVGLLLWTGPLLDDNLSAVGADTYLALDDAGWMLLGTAGISIGVMILAVSTIALRHRLVPAWLGWLSVALGVVSLATVMAVGLFAWLARLLLAAALLLLRGAGRRTETP